MKLVYQYMAFFSYFFTHFKSLQHSVQCGWFRNRIARLDTTPTRHSPNTVLMLGQRLRRWPNIEPTLEKCTMFARMYFCRGTGSNTLNFEIISSSTSYLEYQAGGGKGLVDLVNQLTLERCHSFWFYGSCRKKIPISDSSMPKKNFVPVWC